VGEASDPPPCPLPPAACEPFFGFDGGTGPPQTSSRAGAFSSSNSVFRPGLTFVIDSSSWRLEHEVMITPRRIGPCASWVPKIVAPAWLTHEAQKR
jgi:hypothetical protein